MARSCEERFWSKVRFTDDCWLWEGASAVNYSRGWQSGPYGKFGVASGKTRYVHRIAYMVLVGEIVGELDHLCRQTLCVNPAHLEDTSHRTNMLRGKNCIARLAAVTSCPKGHPYDEENTVRNRNGHRLCDACRREQWRKTNERRRKRLSVAKTG